MNRAKALRLAKKEEKKHIPTKQEVCEEDKDFCKEAKGLRKLLSPLRFLKKN
ncbi:MAG: hypothetical protein ABIF10_00125 [Candidatus Woesearchaeota archaeon]